MHVQSRIQLVQVVTSLLTLALGLAVPAAVADTITVCWDGSGQYLTIQEGIDAANPGQEVVVCDGTYTGPNNRDLDFHGKAITVRSASRDPDNCIIDCESAARAFHFHSGETGDSVVLGFTITGGYVNGSGGAILCDGSSPKIVNCKLLSNEAHVQSAGGGAIACVNASSPIISHCTFSLNKALPALGSGGYGGAIHCISSSSPVIVHCRFTGNQANASGGAICCNGGRPIIIHCTMTGNKAGKELGSMGHAVYCFSASPTIVNCLIADNDDSGEYTATGSVYLSESSPIITNCTIAKNECAAGGGLYCEGESQPVLTNCILWANTPAQIGPPSANPIVTYSDVQGGWFGAGNINEDPLFAEPPLPPPDPWNEKFYLSQTAAGQGSDSPCLNAGNDTAENMGFAASTTRTDLVTDDLQVDMGYHFPADCNANEVPDPLDIALGDSLDCNYNGIPDECEFGGHPPECEGLPDPGNFTTDEDFEQGTLINVHHDTPDQLRRYQWARPLPYIWIAATGLGRGTILRICTEDVAGVGSEGDILGEYLSAPDNTGSQPSRTSGDLDGNVWVANRGDNQNNTGSVVKVGLLVGGTRCDATGTPNAYGNYLKPPFKYNTCVDRDGDRLIRTSPGLDNILPWTPPRHGSVATAEDECILNYVRVSAGGTRHVSVNADNDVWVSGILSYNPHRFDRVHGDTIVQTFTAEGGGYGGLIVRDAAGDDVLWSADQTGGAQGLLRYPINDPPAAVFRVLPGSYGLGIDRAGNIWNTQFNEGTIIKFKPDGDPFPGFEPPGKAYVGFSGDRGVVVTLADDDVWVANSTSSPPRVTRLDSVAENPVEIELGGDGLCPTGMAVDAQGKVWVTCRDSSTLKRIDPGLGEVDLTVTLPDNAKPYNYSDMTGQVTLHTASTGTWNVVHDGGRFEAEWHLVRWNREECPDPPADTEVTVEVRAADFQAALTSEQYQMVDNGKRFDGVLGKLIEVRVRFKGNYLGAPIFWTPVLCDLGVSFGLGDLNCDGVTDFDDIDPFTLALASTPPYYPEYYAQFPDCDVMLADINGDGEVNFEDIDPFIALLSG